MAKGDKLPVVMGREKAAPGGVATLGDDGVLEEAQRPKITAGDNITLKQEGSALEIGAVVPGKNLLINWDFRKPVNRNGKREYTGFGYTIDRWSTEGTTVKVEADGLLLENTSDTGSSQFVSTFEASRLIDGQIYTASLFLKNLVGSGSMVVQYREGAYTYLMGAPLSDGLISVSNRISTSGITILGYMVRIEPNSSVKLIAAKLELGSVQTLARQNTDGEWEIIDPPDYDLQYLLCSQYSQSTWEWVGSQHSNENLLDNSRLDINQRGLSEYTNYGYTVDRWALGGSAKNGKYTAASKTLSCDATTTAFIYLEQKIESPSRFAGKTLTLSALFGSANRAIVQIWRSNSSGTVALAASGTWGNDLFQFCSAKIPNDVSDSDYIRIIVQTQNSIQIKAAKLELGPVQTLAHKDGDTWVLNDPPPNKALELAKCQRYQAGKLYGNIRMSGVWENGMDFIIPTPVTMRVPPTFTNAEPIVKSSALSDQSGFTFQVVVYPGYIRVIASKQAHGLTDAILTVNNVFLDSNL